MFYVIVTVNIYLSYKDDINVEAQSYSLINNTLCEVYYIYISIITVSYFLSWSCDGELVLRCMLEVSSG